MSGFFNLASLFLGLISWIIPVFAANPSREGHLAKNFSIYSFTSCAAALIFQLFELRQRANMEDLSGIMDTIGAICVSAVVLVVVTVAINITAAGFCKVKRK